MHDGQYGVMKEEGFEISWHEIEPGICDTCGTQDRRIHHDGTSTVEDLCHDCWEKKMVEEINFVRFVGRL